MKIAKEVLFNLKPFLLLTLFLSIGIAQLPKYDINDWVGTGFNKKAYPFFQFVSLQMMGGAASISPTEAGMIIGFSITTGYNFKRLGLRNRAGMFPTLYGNLSIGTNLRFVGTLTSFTSQKDITIFSSLGMDISLGDPSKKSSNWNFRFDRGVVEGPDDFFLKTIGVRMIRGINYSNGDWWYGMGAKFFDAGIHIKLNEKNETYRKRMNGKINHFIVGASRTLGKNYLGEIEFRLHPSVVILAISLSRIVK